MIYSQLNRPKTVPSEAGSRYLNMYQENITKKGIELVKTGQTDVFELIQKDADSCNIENILRQVAMGDLNALQQREATYVDATTLPHSLMEAQNLTLRLKDEFMKMPVEVRRLFNNSAEQYVNEMGTNEFLEKNDTIQRKNLGYQ